MRIENSSKFEAEMAAHRAKEDAKRKKAKAALDRAIAKGHGSDWTPMEECPFEAFDLWTGSNDPILVTDGTTVTVARIHGRFGTPIFWKTQPEMVYRDGMMCLEGGVEDPRPDLPKWWWKWEIRDELESETYSRGEPSGQPEVDFVATHWRFLPKPPLCS